MRDIGKRSAMHDDGLCSTRLDQVSLDGVFMIPAGARASMAAKITHRPGCYAPFVLCDDMFMA